MRPAESPGTQELHFHAGRPLALGLLRSVWFSADPNANLHRDNDRKLEGGIQGCEAVNFCAGKTENKRLKNDP